MITAVKDNTALTLYGVEGGEGARKMVTIGLNGTLGSLVFVPFLYLDGIESIEYPWIGGQFLKYVTIRTEWTDLDHHGNDAKDLQDVQDPLYDYVPNTLLRYYDFAAKEIKEGKDPVKGLEKYPLTAANEWIYGPAWAVQYHMNPGSAAADYAKNAPKFNVLEPDVLYYNTRAAESKLGVTSPENFFIAKITQGTWSNFTASKYGKYGLWSPKGGSFDASKEGVLTAGIKIAHPDLLAPWPTDETINPNGNPGSTVSYPAANATTDKRPTGEGQAPAGAYAGDKTDEGYPAGSELETDWYGLSKYKYDKNNTDNTVALQLKNEDGNLITSDYALLVPTRVQLEGLIWYNKPMYIEPNMPGYTYGPNRTTPGTRIGDEEGFVDDKRIHVWDSPEEALADPDGASLELFVGDQIDLTKYLGVHYIKENYRLREKTPGVYNDFSDVYELGAWKYGEEAAFGLHYEFQFVDYYNSTNQTHDSRYAAFNDWNKTWNGWKEVNVIGGDKCNRTGIVTVKSVNAEGETQDIESTTSVDREPLVRVMLKNEEGKVLLDGYILLHINYEPDNTEILYPEQKKEWDLCNGLTLSTTWAQFSNIMLQKGLSNEMILAFNDYYWADCKTGGTIQNDDAKYVTPDANDVMPTKDGHAQYQLRLFNFGDLYGNNISAQAQKAMKNGGAAAYEENALAGFQSNQGLGVVYYQPNGEGTTNHVIHWYLSPEEIEYITHDKADKDYPITVSRWVRYVAKDERRGREVNNYSAPYPYVWVKLTMTISRKANSVSYGVKDENYWYRWSDGAAADKWSAILFDIQAPRDNIVIDRFANDVPGTLVAEYAKNPNTMLNIQQEHKYYFAPKVTTVEFYTLNREAKASTTKITEALPTWNYPKPLDPSGDGVDMQDGTSNFKAKTIKSVLEGFEKLPAKLQEKLLASGQVKKEIRYISPLNTASFNVATMKADITKKYNISALPHPDVLGLTEDYDNVKEWNQLFCKYVYPHDYANLPDFDPDPVKVTKAQDKHQWVEANLKSLLNNCAIDYNNGAFNNNELYSFDPATKTYTLIAILNQDNGAIELVKDEPVAFEEAKLVLNAVGYPTKETAEGKIVCDFDNPRSNTNVQLRGWVGVVANNGCDVAMYTYPEKTDDNLNTFLVSWERPLNTDPNPIKPALDANSRENFIHLIDYLKLYDWRGDYTNQGYMYKDPNTTRKADHYWFWTYYQVKSIILDLNPQYAWTNLHYGTDYRAIAAISGQVDLWAYNDAFPGMMNKGLSIYNFYDVLNTNFRTQSSEQKLQDFMGRPDLENPTTVYDRYKQRFGTIYYQNNAENVTEFDVFVPYTIEYEWGWLSRIADFHIDTTHGR